MAHSQMNHYRDQTRWKAYREHGGFRASPDRPVSHRLRCGHDTISLPVVIVPGKKWRNKYACPRGCGLQQMATTSYS